MTPRVAELLVAEGRAEVSGGNGRIRSIRLVECAATCATLIGPAIKPINVTSVRFVRRIQTEAGTYWEHHPRALEPPE